MSSITHVRRARHWAVALSSLTLLCGAPARAADPVAESMFQDALAQMMKGNFTDACPKLEASHKLEPKSGTLVTLASCHEQVGKTATAWAQYKEAAGMARQEGRDGHAETATELAGKLEPRLSKLTLDAQVRQGGAALTVRLDGRTVLEGTFGVAFAIDPGPHLIEASAPGRKPWSMTIDMGPHADTRTVAIPELERLPAPAPSWVQPPPPPVLPPFRVAPALPDEGGVPAWAWVTGGVGVALAAASVGFLVDSRSAGSDLDEQCGGSERDRCPSSVDFDGLYAREKRSFGLFGGFGAVGLIGIGAGIVGIASSAASSSTQGEARFVPWAGPDGGGIGANGSF